MRKSIAMTSLAALVAAGFAGLSGADTASPGLSPAILANIEAGQPMRMEYQIKASAWLLFLPITGKANFAVDMNQDTYSIKSKVKTTGLADILVNYDLDVAASGYTTPDGLNTYAYVSQNKDGKKNRRVDVKLLKDEFQMTATPKFGNLGDPAATTEQVLDAKDPVTALISFALEPREAGADPCGGPLKIFDGRQLTHLHLTNEGKKNVKSEAWSGEAWECHITMDKVAGYKPGEVNKDTLTGIEGPLRMWLAPLPNGASVPVRIEADTEDIGKVTLQAAKLTFTPIETD
ncbi:MAG: DUF3108 domain-containing protein [Henriciella sp.]|nr:DUF3108 domain-containing protein [Henriciella sp.]